ncbi:unnamed protein product [Protopolystoma xenopodis]|uniref:Helicase-associated domain-containing protein n=1 Tax=Protopolystoma xenopodis TaxID=117903 RepID=A0A3S5AJA2_9PLAT|nr:unnamed protein product [Protopolystoma xenopodis]
MRYSLKLGSVNKFLSSCMDSPSSASITSTLRFLRDISALRHPKQSGAIERNCRLNLNRTKKYPELQTNVKSGLSASQLADYFEVQSEQSSQSASSSQDICTDSNMVRKAVGCPILKPGGKPIVKHTTVVKDSAEIVTADDCDELTPLGLHLANLPLDPQCAKLLLLGAMFRCLQPAVIVAACLAFRDPFEVSSSALNQ